MSVSDEDILCPHCGNRSADSDYCDSCHRAIAPPRPAAEVPAGEWPGAELVHRTPPGEAWAPALVAAEVYWSAAEPTEAWFAHDLPPEYVEVPFRWVAEDRRWGLCFLLGGRPRLADDLRTRAPSGRPTFADCVPVLLAAFELCEAVHRRNLLVGALDPDALLARADGEDGPRLTLLQTRPFLPLEGPPGGAELVPTRGYDSPEVRNGRAELWSPASDVFVVGGLLVGLLTGRPRFTDFAELEHLAHQLRGFAPSAPPELHAWLALSCSADPERRFATPAQQRDAFRSLLRRAEERAALPTRALRLGGGGNSRMGIGKIKDEDDFRHDREVNQDRHVFEWGPGGRGEVLAAVADGISNARHGDGSRAAELVDRELRLAWEAGRMSTLDEIERVLVEANEKVVEAGAACAEEAGAREPAPGDLMGATAAVCVVRGNRAHVVSCGDTRVYLWSPQDGLMLLTPDHHELNRLLRAGAEWREARGREDAEALTSHLGRCTVANGVVTPRTPEFFAQTVPLRPGELLVLCTDGLTDYFGRVGGGKGRWDAEAALADYLEAEAGGERPAVKRLVERLIDQANRNGGGDNITTVIVRVAEPAPDAPTGPEARPERSGRKKK